jgi:hypothetical protein
LLKKEANENRFGKDIIISRRGTRFEIIVFEAALKESALGSSQKALF